MLGAFFQKAVCGGMLNSVSNDQLLHFPWRGNRQASFRVFL